ncbi:hypothetical protein [Pelagovum pacificum]|uniref:DUF7697 family protein n=1 Tax=Pelagovum pacificum TaxID=2588711 RepID=UPI00112333DF|nr:hypothetical protein [Pelagovum pacificum]QQA43958.1 hypothetical protein I8N54_05100 [Pelagovum pacificum]
MQRAGRQLRRAGSNGVPVGLDVVALFQMGGATGVDLAALTQWLPLLEAETLAALDERQEHPE